MPLFLTQSSTSYQAITTGIWIAVTTEPTSTGIGNPPCEPASHAVELLGTFAGVERT